MIFFIIALNMLVGMLSSSLWTIYLTIELQWMLLLLVQLTKASEVAHRWSVQYVLFNSMLSLFMLLALLYSNYSFICIILLNKMAFFPSMFALSNIYKDACYAFLFIDLLSKLIYINALCLITSTMASLDILLIISNIIIIVAFISCHDTTSFKLLLLLSSVIFFSYIMLFGLLPSNISSITLYIFTCLYIYITTICIMYLGNVASYY
jgi:hypothetical protein